MSHRGKPSTAHEYDKAGVCIHCGMYRNNVELLNHNCTPIREMRQDELDRIAGEQEQRQLAEAESEGNDHGE